MYVAIKLHKSEVPYSIKGEYVIQVHDVSPQQLIEEDAGLGNYSIITTIEL